MDGPKVTKSSGYALTLEAGASFNPVDATTYFAGSLSALGAGTTAAERRVYIPRPGVIQVAYLYFLTAGTLGSSETSSISIRVNDTTDYLITNAVALDARSKALNNSGMSVGVQAGDYVELKWVTPTWVTNPTTVRYTANLFIRS
jgi:hypothetical protein